MALVFARAIGAGSPRVQVAWRYVDTGAIRPEQPVDLGSARLPIYLRIADLADELNRRGGQGSLDDLLGFGVSLGRPVYLDRPERKGKEIDPKVLTDFLLGALGRQEAVVFLDGLDEITNPADRQPIVNLIHRFLDVHFAAPAGQSAPAGPGARRMRRSGTSSW